VNGGSGPPSLTDLSDISEEFEVRGAEGSTLIVVREHAAAVVQAGLDRPQGWDERIAAGATGAGRGGTARLDLADGLGGVLKRMRRGGMLAKLWRDRFAGRRRLLENLRVPLEATRRGIATAAPVALLLVEGPPGLYRAWLALEEILGASNLVERLSGERPPDETEVDAVVGLIRRMHDRGIEHPDLNLGNLLLRDRPDGEGADAFEPFVVDLDRARVLPGALSWTARVRALRRLERSSVKLFGERPIEGFDLRRRWYEAYACGDEAWLARLERARRANRFWLSLHRLGWKN